MEALLNANAQAVLKVLQASETHPTAQEVYSAVRRVRPHIGLATVYRILHQLAEQGVIKVWGYGSECARYDARTHRHDHAFCIECGALSDVPVEIALPEETLARAALATNLEMNSHEIRIYGRCKNCQTRDQA